MDAMTPSIAGKRLARVKAIPDQLAFLLLGPARPDNRGRNRQVSQDDIRSQRAGVRNFAYAFLCLSNAWLRRRTLPDRPVEPRPPFA